MIKGNFLRHRQIKIKIIKIKSLKFSTSKLELLLGSRLYRALSIEGNSLSQIYFQFQRSNAEIKCMEESKII